MNDDNTLRTFADIGMDAARQREPVPDVDRRRPEPARVLAVAEIECHDGASIWGHGRDQVLDAFDPRDYEAVQPSTIPVLHRHDRAHRVGRVVHLEWGKGEPARILAAIEVDADEAEAWAGQDVFISPGTKRNARGRLVLDHVGLVPSTARIAAGVVRWAGTTFEGRSRWTRQTTPGFDLLMRAHDARRKRAKSAGIPIVGHPGHDEQLEEQRYDREMASKPGGVLMPEYMRHNGEDGIFYSGGVGRILRVE